MRSKKIEAEIKNDTTCQAIGKDWTGHPIEKFTNEGADAFCPYIDNKRLAKVICSKHGEGIIHREYPTSVFYPPGVTAPEHFDITKVNLQNRHYHWAQIDGFKSVQFCRFQRDGVSKDSDLCEKYFTTCPVYKEHIKEQ
jgi:hypothetical protein